MQVTELESKGLKKKLKIVVDAAQVNTQVESELRAAGENVRIPGFRPGYVPMAILKQRFGKSVEADVLKKVINNATSEVLTQKSLRPTEMPKVDLDNYKEGADLEFTLAFDVFPEVKEPAFDAITLDRKVFEMTDEAVDDALQTIVKSNPKFKKLEDGSAAKLGNVVNIDFKGSMDGKLFDGGSANNFRLELGSGQFIEGFEDQLVGAKEDETRTVAVTFPKNYSAPNLAGKEASFEVKIKEIQSKEIPEIDEEFAKMLGFLDVGALRDSLREQLIKEYDKRVRSQMKKQLFDLLEKECNFELPESMVELEFNTIWEQFKEAQARGDESASVENEEELKAEYQQIAQRRVKLGLLLAEVGSRNKIQISREELSQAVFEQASAYPGQERKIMEFYRNNPDRVESLRGPILEEKAVDVILSKVKFNDYKVSLEDLRDGMEEGEEGNADEEKSDKPKKSSRKKSAKAEDEPAETKENSDSSAKPKTAAKKKAAGNKE